MGVVRSISVFADLFATGSEDITRTGEPEYFFHTYEPSRHWCSKAKSQNHRTKPARIHANLHINFSQHAVSNIHGNKMGTLQGSRTIGNCAARHTSQGKRRSGILLIDTRNAVISGERSTSGICGCIKTLFDSREKTYPATFF